MYVLRFSVGNSISRLYSCHVTRKHFSASDMFWFYPAPLSLQRAPSGKVAVAVVVLPVRNCHVNDAPNTPKVD